MITELRDYLAIAGMVLTIGQTVYLIVMRRSIATDQRVGDVEEHLVKKYEDLAARMGTVEGDLHAAPTHDDLTSLHRRLDELSAGLHKLSGECSAQVRVINLLLDRHLSNS